MSTGQTWDEGYSLFHGQVTLKYLFSLGKIDEYIFYREYFSSIYWSLLYLLTKIFPLQYQIEVVHITNLIFSFGTIIGIGKFSKELFNNKVGKIVFLILFFYPVFFGHMSFNNKDTILAFSHVWIACLILKYLKNQNNIDKTNNYVISIGLLAALATGIQLFFLGTLIPFFLFILLEIFVFKKFINKNFNMKKFLYDFLKCFLIFYFLLILFWIDVHPNIFILPFNIIMKMFSVNYMTGVPFNLINGNYYLSQDVPKFYLFINFIYKSPEYFLLSYLFFLVLFLKIKKFFDKRFEFFIYKFILIIFILAFSNLLLVIIPFPVYDGMRLFLWTIPYMCIIPGLTIYYLIENFNLIKSKLALFSLSILFIYFLSNFFAITPYQYTYLNFLNGKTENRYKKFENDYWGSSINELIKNTIFDKNKIIKISTCGVSTKISKRYFIKRGHFNLKFVQPEQADYVIMTNRVTLVNEKTNDFKNLTNCFDKYKGNDISIVKRNGLILSVIRKKL